MDIFATLDILCQEVGHGLHPLVRWCVQMLTKFKMVFHSLAYYSYGKQSRTRKNTTLNLCIKGSLCLFFRTVNICYYTLKITNVSAICQ